MIENVHQLEITRRWVEEFTTSVRAYEETGRVLNVLQQAQLDVLRAIRDELQKQVDVWP